MITSPPLRPVSQDSRSWDRLLARVRAPFLDSQLAAGRSPRASRLMAIRAQEITSPAGRQVLVRQWVHVLDRARRPPPASTPCAPLQRDHINAAESDIRTMLAFLAGPRPIKARGAAIASTLVGDGTGPLYNRRCPLGLGATVREATRQMMDPWASPSSELQSLL